MNPLVQNIVRLSHLSEAAISEVMPLTTFVDKTVNGLKSLLDHNGTIKLFGSGGDITESQVIFPDYGASEDEIQNFESKHCISFAVDCKKFLMQHNGARIFDIVSDGENIGG